MGRDCSWERALPHVCDLLIVERSLLPEPACDAIRSLRKHPDAPSLVILSGGHSPQEEADLLAAGADAVLLAGLLDPKLAGVLGAILNRRRELTRVQRAAEWNVVRPQLADFDSTSATMRVFMNLVGRVVHADTSLLILGETGVGKERLARAIHAESPRRDGPFVTVSCGSLPEHLLESELFGHEEGAFTGATRARRGLLELAHKGTAFLDEIGDMPYHVQVKLLHFLQGHEIQPVGGEQPIPVDVRVMAATNRSLEEDVEAKRFRKDLFFRLSVVTLTVPPLRDHWEDIAGLVHKYIDHFSTRIPCEVDGIADDALQALYRYAWPGNVRELINVVERATLLANGREIALDELPIGVSGQLAGAAVIPLTPDAVPEDWLRRPLSDVRRAAVSDLEHAYLAALLRETGGGVAETARRAGMDPRSLHLKMKRYGLRKEDFKRPRKRR
jgi:DNA-binding NtrC family response regulator